jgi:hypothetical protein
MSAPGLVATQPTSQNRDEGHPPSWRHVRPGPLGDLKFGVGVVHGAPFFSFFWVYFSG